MKFNKYLLAYLVLLTHPLSYSSDSSPVSDFSSSYGSQPSWLRDRSSDDELGHPLRDDKEIDAMVNEKLREAIRQKDDSEITRIIVGGENYDESDIQMGLTAQQFTLEIYERLKKDEGEETARKYAQIHHLKDSPVATKEVITNAEKMRGLNVLSALQHYLPEEIAIVVLEFKP